MNLLRNATPWRAQALPFVDDAGRDGRLLVVKLQYAIEGAGRLVPAEQIEPLIHEDRFEGDGPDAPLLRPADVMAPQPSTNVMLLGHAYAPRAEGVHSFEPWLGIGPVVFPLRVHGPREWRSRWLVTRGLSLFALRRFKQVATERVTRLPLRWQHAYGGVDAFLGQSTPQSWAANPAGSGYHEAGQAAVLHGLTLPAIEDPRNPVRRWQDRRAPQLPGAVSPHWAPRSHLGGTRDTHWLATRAPALPDDAAVQFHNTAHPGLQITPHLVGGEALHAVGFCADGRALGFDLPAPRLDAHAYHYGAYTPLPLNLDTVILEPDESRLTLLYRGFAALWQNGFELRRMALGSAEHPVELRP